MSESILMVEVCALRFADPERLAVLSNRSLIAETGRTMRLMWEWSSTAWATFKTLSPQRRRTMSIAFCTECDVVVEGVELLVHDGDRTYWTCPYCGDETSHFNDEEEDYGEGD